MTDPTSSTPGPDTHPDDAQQGDTQHGDAPQGAQEPRGASFDVSEVFPDMVAYGKELLDRVSDRAAEMAPKIREKGYDADQWVDDVQWFWENVTKDAVRAAKYWRGRFPVA